MAYIFGENPRRLAETYLLTTKDKRNYIGQENLKSIKRIKKLKTPSARSITHVEFNEKENFERHIVFVEDKEGKSVTLLVYKDRFKPNRDIIGSSNEVYGDASTVGSIEMAENINDPLINIERQALRQAKEMRESCEMSGVKRANKNIQLSGMSAIIIPNADEQDALMSSDLQETIAFLFGNQGPFKDVVIFPEDNQLVSLAEKIKGHGGRVLTQGNELNLNIEDFVDLQKRLIGESGRAGNDIVYKIVRGLLVGTPFHIHRAEQRNNEDDLRTEITDLPKYLQEIFSAELGVLKEKFFINNLKTND